MMTTQLVTVLAITSRCEQQSQESAASKSAECAQQRCCAEGALLPASEAYKCQQGSGSVVSQQLLQLQITEVAT